MHAKVLMTSIFLIFKIEKIRHDILQQLVQIMESQLELEGLGTRKTTTSINKRLQVFVVKHSLCSSTPYFRWVVC